MAIWHLNYFTSRIILTIFYLDVHICIHTLNSKCISNSYQFPSLIQSIMSGPLNYMSPSMSTCPLDIKRFTGMIRKYHTRSLEKLITGFYELKFKGVVSFIYLFYHQLFIKDYTLFWFTTTSNNNTSRIRCKLFNSPLLSLSRFMFVI